MPTELGSPSAMLASETADRRPWLWCRQPSPMLCQYFQPSTDFLEIMLEGILVEIWLMALVRSG